VNPQFAILMDGGFVRRVLQKGLPKGTFATATDIQKEVDRISAHEEVAGLDLLRVYFYDAPPAAGNLRNPMDGTTIDLGKTAVGKHATSLHDSLELRPNFALRMGETAVRGWVIGSKAEKAMMKSPRPCVAADLVPNIEQKGVDLRIGLDIARLSLSGRVRTIVVVTGDSDLVPAFKFARREGLRVYLDHMGQTTVRRQLKAHADIIL
jgi:uncharacterized LabA/DUF88 family protein